MSFLQQLLDWDRELFTIINGQWTNSFFDAVLPYTRNPFIWVPFYLFIIVFTALNYRRNGFFWILFGILTVATTDMVSSRVFKELFFRLRPCNDEVMAGHVRLLLNHCSQNSSFTSSHAANHFGMAMFIFITLKTQLGKWVGLIFLWAFIIGYAQIYVGVHYPFDIAGGAIIGIIIGYFWARFFKHHFSLSPTLN